jgi:hypothetical protein
LRAALRAAIRAARRDDAAWDALDQAMGVAPEPGEGAAIVRPWQRVLSHLVELDRRRAAGLLSAETLTWLEAEGLMVLDEERAKRDG